MLKPTTKMKLSPKQHTAGELRIRNILASGRSGTLTHKEAKDVVNLLDNINKIESSIDEIIQRFETAMKADDTSPAQYVAAVRGRAKLIRDFKLK